MAAVHMSLEQISTGHCVFEQDQVLTHDQLNSVAGYADDQIRLTRVRLLGVGIACGLRVTSSPNTVTVSKGIGVTTDGDLLHLDADTVFDRYTLYDASHPAYPPLFVNGDTAGTMITAHELVRSGATDDRAQPLTGFAADAGGAFSDRVAVLLMESYIRDDDLCSGTDCDNLGREAVHALKLLLVDRTAAAVFREAVQTPAAAAAALEEIVAERPALPTNLDAAAALAAHYRTACNNMHTRLETILPQIEPACRAFLGDAMTANTAGTWIGRLNNVRSAFANSATNVQYYYDFLKDVIATYNEFREQLFEDATWCAPTLDAFPKHLLLGDVAGGSANRTGFYPSPLVSRSAQAVDHAHFLLRKLDALVNAFSPTTAANAPIRITPSAFEDRPLEERAIPFYYPPGTSGSVHTQWSFMLSRRGADATNYAYHAASFNARGAAANPLGAQIGRFPFFRIEGHAGRPLASALPAIEREITAHNLPFTVRAVMLGTDRTRVVRKPGTRFTDLHHLHYLVRTDVAHRLDDVAQFSSRLKQQVDSAVAAGTVVDTPADNDGVAIRTVAAQKSVAVSSKAADASSKLSRNFAAYSADASWRSDLADALKFGGEYKADLSPVVKTDFNTPIDTLIGSTVNWLPWLDDILGRKEEKEDERLLFRTFATEHPQVEHFAGVLRGGTFVLLYDTNNNVVGDVMLPYYCPEPEKEDPVEPPLLRPGILPGYVIDHGLKLVPSRNTYVDRKLSAFEPRIDAKINLQSKYFDVLRDSYINVVKDSLQVLKADKSVVSGLTGTFNDKYLGLLVEENHIRMERIDVLEKQIADPNVDPAMKQVYQSQLADTQKDLSTTIQRTADYVANANISVAPGSEGHTAIVGASAGMSKIKDTTVVAATTTNLQNTAARTTNTGFKVIIGSMIGRTP